jgi:hypothetical protein
MRNSMFKLSQDQNSSEKIEKNEEIRIWDFDLRPIPKNHQIDWEHLNRSHEVHKIVVGPNPPVVWWSI